MIYERDTMLDGTVYEKFEGEVSDIAELLEILQLLEDGIFFQSGKFCNGYCDSEELFDNAFESILKDIRDRDIGLGF